MKGKLYLSGGGSAKQTYKADMKIFKDVKTILYIPFAWDEDLTYESCKEWFSTLMILHNISNYTMMKNPSSNIDLSKYDMIYIGGGNTFKLLKELKESELGNKIITYLNCGGKVYGGSAGAIIFGQTILPCTIGSCSDENLVGLKDLTGFNLIDYDIHCHFDKITDFKLIEKYCKEKKREIIAIAEENVVEIINRKIVKIYGEEEIKIFSITPN